MRNETLVYGIDLGTTNSCIARATDTGHAEVISNLDRMLTTPSVVYFGETGDDPVVGVEAKRVAKAMPDSVCAHVKRIMGKEGALVDIRGQEYTPEYVSALILRKVINDALESDGEPRGSRVKAVITIPAYFDSAAKNATRQAGMLADVDVMDLLQEPVAAAIAYGFTRVDHAQNLLVYDLGGGTFDATVVRVDGASARTVATEGERLLGGIDWDQRIVKWMRQQFQEENPGRTLPVDDAVLNQRLYEEAEKAKHTLSQLEKATLAVHHDGESFAFDLTRSTFEQISDDLLSKTLDKTMAVIDQAKAKGISGIDRLLLVGGSSKMPAVKRKLKEALGLDGTIHDPDLAVAKGAALVADLIERGKHSVDKTGRLALPDESRLVTMVNSKSIGVQVYDPDTDKLHVDYVILRNSELPASAEKTYYTRLEHQPQLRVCIFEQREEESEIPEENSLLHQDAFDLPEGLPLSSPLDYRFTLDGLGILHVFMKEPKSGKSWEMKVNRYETFSDDEILRLKPAIAQVR